MKRRYAQILASPRGMTLIELILVMGLLATVMAIATPKLTSFFAGRRSTEEIRRLLALTRFARSEAIAQSTPMELWVDPRNRAYGLRPQTWNTSSAEEMQTKAQRMGVKVLEYTLADNVELDVVDTQQLDSNGVGIIRYLPDGTIDEGSMTTVGVVDAQQRTVYVTRSLVGAGFTIQDTVEQP